MAALNGTQRGTEGVLNDFIDIGRRSGLDVEQQSDVLVTAAPRFHLLVVGPTQTKPEPTKKKENKRKQTTKNKRRFC